MIRRLALAALAALALWPAAASAQVITSTPPSCAKAGANTVTASAPVLDCTQTWNNAGITFYGFRLNVTDTASSSVSLLMDLQVAGATKFNVRKDGYAFALGGYTNAVQSVGLDGAGLSLGASLPLRWSSTANWFDTPDVLLRRDAANTLALRNGVNAQRYNVYGTYTDASNFERLSLIGSGTAFSIGTDSLGTGAARPLQFYVSGTNIFKIETTGHLLWNADNTYDIGASGANRPRSIYAATNIVTGAGGGFLFSGGTALTSGANGNLILSNAAGTSFGLLQLGGTTSSFPALKRNGAGLDFKLADDSAFASIGAASVSLTSNLSGISGTQILFGTNARITDSGTNGLLVSATGAGSGFGLLQFGGTTSSFPALKRSSTTVAVRLADDSADGDISGGNITSSGSTNAATLRFSNANTAFAGSAGTTSSSNQGDKVSIIAHTNLDSAGAGTAAVYAQSFLDTPTLTATNARTYTNASNLYILGAPVSSTNVTVTTPYSLYVAAGTSYFGGGAKVPVVAVASLPTCNAAAEGLNYGVNDSNTTTFHAAVAAGGANHVQVYCDATSWKVGG